MFISIVSVCRKCGIRIVEKGKGKKKYEENIVGQCIEYGSYFIGVIEIGLLFFIYMGWIVRFYGCFIL